MGNESNVCIHIAEMDQKYSEIRVRPKLIFIKGYVSFKHFLGRALWLWQARGPSAAATCTKLIGGGWVQKSFSRKLPEIPQHLLSFSGISDNSGKKERDQKSLFGPFPCWDVSIFHSTHEMWFSSKIYQYNDLTLEQ